MAYYTESIKLWKGISKDGISKNAEFDIKIHQKILDFFQVGDYYYYIFNLKTAEFDFVSDSMSQILGYGDISISVQDLFEKIHPDDVANFVNFENTASKFFHTLTIEKIMKYKIRYDFRIQKSDGEYIRILHQVIPIEATEEGGILRTLGIHTDITHLKTDNKSALSFIGMDGEPSYFNVEIQNIFSPSGEIFTKREKELLSYFCKGKNRSEIAAILNISKHTVDTHRRKMLAKTKCNSITGLISKAIHEGWI